MRRPYLVAAALCLFVALGCAVFYQTFPAHLDEQGVLIEAFALIPLAWFFSCVGAGLLLLAWVRRK
jgi:hypothetical protein